MSTNNAKKQIIAYLVIVFLASIPWYVLISANGGLEAGGAGYVVPLMWTSALAGLLTAFIYQRNLRGIGWGLGILK